MDDSQRTKILSRVAAGDFVGRSVELDAIRKHAESETGGRRGLLLLSAPLGGASELLLQVYDQIFYEQGGDEILPVYFAVKPTDRTAKGCALRFLQTFLLQTAAFRHRDAKLLGASPEISEIAGLAPASDARWINSLISSYERESRLGDEHSFVRNCLSAPSRAAKQGTKVFVMIDDLHNAQNLTGETNFIEELKEIYAHSPVQFVFAGGRRYLLKSAQSGVAVLPDVEVCRLQSLSVTDAEILVAKFSAKYGVRVNEQSRDLIVRQFDSNLLFIKSIFIAAAGRGKNLDSFQNVQQIYADELFGGRIGKFLDWQFQEIEPDFNNQTQLIRLLHEAATSENKKIKPEEWRNHFAVSDERFFRLLRALHTREIINFGSNVIEISDENLCLRDYVEGRARLEILTEQRARVVGDQLAKSLRRASQLMMRFYKCASAVNVRQLLEAFRGQSLPASLINYAEFKDAHKGATAEEILHKLETEKDQIKLPQIVFSAPAASYYPALKQVADEEQSAAVGIGFLTADYRKENEIAWIVAEVYSKLEASAELTEFWCDRLEMVALAGNFANYRLWLITPEGFSPEAVEVLRRRGAFGSSREQIKLLSAHLNAENVIREKNARNEYEMIVPMGDDTELIAARTIEEIARRHGFKPRDITQIKTALVEACINATEHSHSPDRKIYQKFAVEDDKIVITISNRGVKIPSEKVAEMTMRIEPDEGRRGWGLKLMRTLMDEVEFEQVDDGTKISMVKYLK